MQKTAAITTIYLIRHAEAEGNLYRRIHGWYNSLITDNGFRQIEALRRRFQDVPVDAAYSSDLYRTMTTARAVYRPKGLLLRTDPDLRELHMGAWEDKPWGELRRFHPAEMEQFNATDPAWRAPGGEDFVGVGKRMEGALLRIARAHPGQTVAVFSHGTAIRQALAQVRGIAPEDRHSLGHSDNTAVSRMDWDGARFTVVFEGDNSHLDESISTLARQNWWRKDRGQAADVNLWYRPEPEENGRVRFSAISGGEDVGLLELDPARFREDGAGYISSGSILPARRGQSLGVQLIGQAVAFFRPMGRDRLRLSCGPADRAAQRFCAKHGFVKLGEDGGLDLMEKYIGYAR